MKVTIRDGDKTTEIPISNQYVRVTFIADAGKYIHYEETDTDVDSNFYTEMSEREDVKE